MINKTMERCSALLVAREMKIKIRNQNHSTFITMTKLKKKKKRLTIPNAGKNVEQLELSYSADGNTALV